MFGFDRSATPRPVFRTVDESRSDGVPEHVVDRVSQVVLVVDDPGGEPLAEEGASPVVARVVLARVVAVQPVERAGEHLVRPFDDGVVVRPHQAIGVEGEARAPDRPAEVEHEEEVVAVVAEEHRLLDRVRGDVEVARRQVGAVDASHSATVRAPTTATGPRRAFVAHSTRPREPRRVSDTRRGGNGQGVRRSRRRYRLFGRGT